MLLLKQNRHPFCLETEPGKWYNTVEQMIDSCKNDPDMKIEQQFDVFYQNFLQQKCCLPSLFPKRQNFISNQSSDQKNDNFKTNSMFFSFFLNTHI